MSVDRRTFLSRLVGAATGMLGALGGSGRPREATAEPADPPAPATTEADPLPDEFKGLVATKEWSALKKVWQEMTRHATRQVRDGKAFEKLQPPMQEAFAGLKKQTAEWKVSPEVLDVLQTVFAGRYGHIQHVYIIETCYAMSLLGGEVRSSRDRLEKQYATLAQWVAKEQIKPEVARKARQLIAQQVEFLALVPRVEGGKGSPQEEEFVKALSAGQEADSAFPVSDRSQQVARLIVELCRP